MDPVTPIDPTAVLQLFGQLVGYGVLALGAVLVLVGVLKLRAAMRRNPWS